jgi:hypothetical protein
LKDLLESALFRATTANTINNDTRQSVISFPNNQTHNFSNRENSATDGRNDIIAAIDDEGKKPSKRRFLIKTQNIHFWNTKTDWN